MGFVQGPEHVAQGLAEDVLHGSRARRHYLHVQAAAAQRGGHFQADEAGADHHAAAGRGAAGDQLVAVGEAAQHADVGQVGAGHVQARWRGAGGQHQGAVVQLFAAGEGQFLVRRVDVADAGVAAQFDALTGIEVRRTQRQPGGVGAAGQVVLGQVGPVVGRGGVGAEQGDGPVVALVAQAEGRRVAGGAATDDHHRGRCLRVGRQVRRGGGQGRADVGLAVAAVHLPARQVVQRRRGEQAPVVQAEAGVVPGAAQGVAVDQALGQGRAVVRAGGAYGVQLPGLAHQQRRFAADVAGERAAFDDVRQGHALGEVGAGRGRWMVAHRSLLVFS